MSLPLGTEILMCLIMGYCLRMYLECYITFDMCNAVSLLYYINENLKININNLINNKIYKVIINLNNISTFYFYIVDICIILNIYTSK